MKIGPQAPRKLTAFSPLGHQSPPERESHIQATTQVETLSLSQAAAKPEDHSSWLGKGMMLGMGAVSLAGAFMGASSAQAADMTPQASQACTLYTYLHNGSQIYHGDGGFMSNGINTLKTLGIKDPELVDLAKQAREGVPKGVSGLEEHFLKALIAPKVTSDCPTFGTSVFKGS
jgi:hypothetical protein